MAIIVDEKIRGVEEDFLKSLGHKIIKLNRNVNVYDQISSHPDIHMCKIGNILVIEPTIYDKYIDFFTKHKESNINLVKGSRILSKEYPNDISYNLFVSEKQKVAIHNFKHTDEEVINILKTQKYNCINVKQGYTNCSIAKVDDTSYITSDSGIYEILKKEKSISLIYIPSEKIDIKLINGDNKFSKMNGFIGGASAILNNTYILFGDIEYINKEYRKIFVKYILDRGLKFKYFKGLEILDLGGIVVI